MAQGAEGRSRRASAAKRAAATLNAPWGGGGWMVGVTPRRPTATRTPCGRRHLSRTALGAEGTTTTGGATTTGDVAGAGGRTWAAAYERAGTAAPTAVGRWASSAASAVTVGGRPRRHPATTDGFTVMGLQGILSHGCNREISVSRAPPMCHACCGERDTRMGAWAACACATPPEN